MRTSARLRNTHLRMIQTPNCLAPLFLLISLRRTYAAIVFYTSYAKPDAIVCIEVPLWRLVMLHRGSNRPSTVSAIGLSLVRAKVSIYRLPYVTASASTGHFRQNRGDFLHNLISGGIGIGSFPSINAKLPVVMPIDYLTKIMATVGTQNLSQIGQVFDF